MSTNIIGNSNYQDPEKIKQFIVQGEILSIQVYTELSEVTEKDVSIAVEDWQNKMGAFSEIVNAEST